METSDKNISLIEKNPILTGVIWKEMLIYFFPILFGTFFQQLYNAVDMLIVGRFIGTEALAATGGSASMMIWMVQGFFIGMFNGASILVAQHYGAEEADKLSKVVHTAFTFAVICGLGMTIFGIASAPTVMRLMNTPADTLEMSVTYVRVYFIGMAGNLIYSSGSGILRAVGDSRRPLWILIFSCLINIVLDLLFIVPLHMGVFGAALATILAQALSALLVLMIMIRTREAYHLDLTHLSIHGDTLKRILKIGVPAGLQCVTYTLSNLVIQTGVNRFGTATVAAWAAYYKIDAFFWMIVNAFGTTASTFVGQNYGAGIKKRVYRCFFWCMGMTLVYAFAMSFLMYLAAPTLFPWFTTDTAVQSLGVSMMRYLLPFYSLCVIMEIITGSLRGIGDTFAPMLIGVCGTCLVRILWVLFYVPARTDLYRLMDCYTLSWVIAATAYVVYFLIFSEMGVRKRLMGCTEEK